MKRIVSIVLVSLLCVSLFTISKYALFADKLPHGNRGMRAVIALDEVSQLYIGSSMFRQGIDAHSIDAHSFLLAYNGNQPIFEALQLKYLIDNHANIKQVIIDMYPYSAAREASISDVKLVMDGNVQMTFDVFDILHQNGMGYQYLYELLVQQNSEYFLTFPISHRLIDTRSLRGSAITTVHGATEAELAKKEIEPFDAYHLHPTQLKGLEEIIRICRASGIQLVFLETPKYIKVREDRQYQSLMNEYASFLSRRGVDMILCEQTAAKLPREVNRNLVTAYQFAPNEALYYTDLYHISYEGRMAFTKLLKRIFLAQPKPHDLHVAPAFTGQLS